MLERDPGTRLRQAVIAGNLLSVRRLVERVPDAVTSADPLTRMTPLALAAEKGHYEIFEFLLLHGSEEHTISKDVDNNTILHIAAKATQTEIIELYHANYPFTLDWCNVAGCTALHVAAQMGDEGTVKLLLDLGADIDLADLKGDSPLHYASAWGNLKVVQLLIERGAAFHSKNNKGWTASDYAFSMSIMSSLQESVRAIFETAKRERSRKNKQANRDRDPSVRNRDPSISRPTESDSVVGLGLAMPPRSASSQSINTPTTPTIQPSTSSNSLRGGLLLSPIKTADMSPSQSFPSPASSLEPAPKNGVVKSGNFSPTTHGESPVSVRWPLSRSRSASGNSLASLTAMSRSKGELPPTPERGRAPLAPTPPPKRS